MHYNRDKQTYLGPKEKIPECPFPQTFKIDISSYQNNLVAGSLGKLSHKLINESEIYSLPLDGMPCIVPDIKQFNMPVIVPDMTQFNMPVIAKKMKIYGK